MRRKGCIIRRGGTYSVVLDLGQGPGTGKRRRQSASGFRTKKEAEFHLTKALAKQQDGTYVEPQHMTVTAFLEKWLTSVGTRLAPRSLQGYTLNVRRHILPALGALELSKLQPVHVQTLYDSLLDRGLLSKTVLYVHRVLHKALKTAVKLRLVALDVSDAVDAPKQTPSNPPTLTAAQVSTLLAGTADLRLLVPVCVAVGVRPSQRRDCRAQMGRHRSELP